MSEPNATEAKKLVLFVEDNHESVIEYREALKQYCQTHLVRTLNGAVRFLESEQGRQVALVVIDLYMPGNHSLLARYESSARDSLITNQGQLLAVWLREHRSGLPFVYLSAFLEVNSDDSITGFSKAAKDKDALVSHICKTLNLDKHSMTTDTDGSTESAGTEQTA